MTPRPEHALRIAFVHAHPDDEAIFTGGTMARLADGGATVGLVMCTGGELGAALTTGNALAPHREQETRDSCRHLGIDQRRIDFLPYEDSGMDAENPSGFVHQDRDQAARRMLGASIALCGGPLDAIVTYDDHGIYGHPDHVAAYEAAHLAAQLHQHEYGTLPTIYEATVDREYLHFVETHVVVDAGGGRPLDRGLASTDLGLSTLDIDLTVDVAPVIERKRAALAAHASQLPDDAPLFELGEANFAAVYGLEWYQRIGPPTALDRIDK